MISPVDLPDIVPSLVIVWSVTLLLMLGEKLSPSTKGVGLYGRVMRAGTLRWLAFGFMMTVSGISQKLHDLHLMTLRLYIFTVITSAMAVSCAGAFGRRQQQTENLERNP